MSPLIYLSAMLMCPFFFSFFVLLGDFFPIFDFSTGNYINFELNFDEQFNFEPSGVPVGGFTAPTKVLRDFPFAEIINAL